MTFQLPVATAAVADTAATRHPTATTTHSVRPKCAVRAQVRGPGAPKPRASIAVARVLPRRMARTSSANAWPIDRRMTPRSAIAPCAPSEAEGAPVVDRRTDEPQRRQRPEHEPGGQAERLGEPVGEVRRVDREEEHDRGQRDRDDAGGGGESDLHRPLGHVDDAELPEHRPGGSAVEHHADPGERSRDPHRQRARRPEQRAEPDGGEQHELAGDRDRGGDDVEREDEHEAQRDGRGDLRHRIHGRERQVGTDGGDAHRRSPCSAAAPRIAPSSRRWSAMRVDERLVVGDGDHADALVAQCDDEAAELAPGGRVLPERRLVEHEHPRSRGDRGRHGEAALLAARERERVRLREAVEPQHARAARRRGRGARRGRA